MTSNDNYADCLRRGEIKRDASDKAAGFLYQDLVAIDLILKSSNKDKIYLEWVEDIYVESDTNIKIVQVKHYPKTSVDFKEIYKELFYQFLIFKIYLKKKKCKKIMQTYCIKYSYNSYNEDICRNNITIKQKESFEDLNINEILTNFDKQKSKEDRINYIINNVANNELLDEFIFKEEDKGSIECISDKLKRNILKQLKEKLEENGLNNDESIDEILLAAAIYIVQKSYVKEGSKDDIASQRYLTKSDLLYKLNEICNVNAISYLEQIKMRILSYIDECYEEIKETSSKNEILNNYFNIYISTKEYIYNTFSEKKNRFRFLNTISRDDYKVLNWNKYEKYNLNEEKQIILEHKDAIKLFFMYVWKILFDVDCTVFNEYIIETEELLLFKFPEEKVNLILVAISQIGKPSKCASNILSRIVKLNKKPKKWYLSGIKGTYEYNYNVNRISQNKLDSKFSVVFTDENIFSIECMNCIKIDEGEMDKKETEISCSLFEFDCIEEK